MTQCLDLRCCIIQIWIGLLIIFRLPNTNCFEVSLVLVRHLSFGKKCNITRSIVISFCIHALLFIRMNFIRIFRLKIVENLRMSQECSEAQIQINIEIFLWTYMKYKWNMVVFVAYATLHVKTILNTALYTSFYHYRYIEIHIALLYGA